MHWLHLAWGWDNEEKMGSIHSMNLAETYLEESDAKSRPN